MLRLKDTYRLEKALNGNTFSQGWQVKEMLIDEISRELEELSSLEEKTKEHAGNCSIKKSQECMEHQRNQSGRFPRNFFQK